MEESRSLANVFTVLKKMPVSFVGLVLHLYLWLFSTLCHLHLSTYTEMVDFGKTDTGLMESKNVLEICCFNSVQSQSGFGVETVMAVV